MNAPVWTSDDPHLSGNFAPIQEEIDAADLPPVSGAIPPTLDGVYMRNGPNPRFQPLSYTYPFDGDGMIHALALSGGRAHYRNRFVRTRAFRAEERVGRAIYSGVMQPRPVDPALLRPGDDPGPFKNGAFINVLAHGGHLLALSEADTAYAMTMDLDTLGEWRAGTDRPITLGAHNRRYPLTGALFAIAYDVESPRVELRHIDAGGTLVASRTVPLGAPTMMHDFVLTERYAVLFACPAVFDLQAAFSGGSPLDWRPQMGTRIALVPLDGSPLRWVETDAFFVFHFANGFERAGEIAIDYVRHAKFDLAERGSHGGDPPRLHRLTIYLATGAVRDGRVADRGVEFPRVNDGRDTRATRWIYLPTRTAAIREPDLPRGSFNAIAKADTETGHLTAHNFGNRLVGEAVFVPDTGRDAEDGGWLALYVFDPGSGTSDFVLLDAKRVEDEPVAVVRMPQRVPQGLHGSWIPRG